MRSRTALSIGLLNLALLAAVPAHAQQWTRVPGVPTTDVFSLWASGDTILAGVDTSAFISTNGGVSWQGSKRIPGATSVQALRLHGGRLYAATFGQGAFVSDNLGASWSAFNQGLVGGILNSQLLLTDFQILGDNLYASTAGAGIYVRGIGGPSTWSHFGDEFEPNQASVVNSLALGGTRLLAMAGANGMVFYRDPGDPDWTVSNLDNVGIHAGLQGTTAIWTGTAWVVGANSFIFRSVAGQEPWSVASAGFGSLKWSTWASRPGQLFGAFSNEIRAVIEQSNDDGATWHDGVIFPGGLVFRMAISGSTLFAALNDGLWRSSISTVSVDPLPPSRRALDFALAGPQPFGEQTRLHFVLPEAGEASIAVYDLAGREATDRIRGSWSAGDHEVALDARGLSPGVYLARLDAGGRRATVRLVHVR